jgi:hypothetical protein
MENIIRNNILAFGRDGITRRTSPLRGGRYVAVVENNIFLLNNSSVFRSGYGMDVFDPVWKSDLNLYWELAEKQLTVEQLIYGGNTREYPFKDWKQRTHNDRHSINKDPGFIDPLNGDFTLPENSPAFDIGFQPVDFSDVGPRDKVEIKSTVREKRIKGHVE